MSDYNEEFDRLRKNRVEVSSMQMRELTIPLLAELKEKIPVIFDDIIVEEE